MAGCKVGGIKRKKETTYSRKGSSQEQEKGEEDMEVRRGKERRKE